jgi:hypothetical protein
MCRLTGWAGLEHRTNAAHAASLSETGIGEHVRCVPLQMLVVPHEILNIEWPKRNLTVLLDQYVAYPPRVR